MSTVLRALDTALVQWHATHPGRAPAVIRLGQRHFAQLLLDVAASPTPLPYLEIANGHPTRYRDVELFADEVVVDGVTVV